jgi:hypothetical protein
VGAVAAEEAAAVAAVEKEGVLGLESVLFLEVGV